MKLQTKLTVWEKKHFFKLIIIIITKIIIVYGRPKVTLK